MWVTPTRNSISKFCHTFSKKSSANADKKKKLKLNFIRDYGYKIEEVNL